MINIQDNVHMDFNLRSIFRVELQQPPLVTSGCSFMNYLKETDKEVNAIVPQEEILMMIQADEQGYIDTQVSQDAVQLIQTNFGQIVEDVVQPFFC